MEAQEWALKNHFMPSRGPAPNIPAGAPGNTRAAIDTSLYFRTNPKRQSWPGKNHNRPAVIAT